MSLNTETLNTILAPYIRRPPQRFLLGDNLFIIRKNQGFRQGIAEQKRMKKGTGGESRYTAGAEK